MEKMYTVKIQFAAPNAPAFSEPQIYDVIQRAIAYYNRKSLIATNPKSIINSNILDPHTLELVLESDTALPYPSKALQVFSRYLVNPNNEGALNQYIYGKQLFKMVSEELTPNEQTQNHKTDTSRLELISLGHNNNNDMNGNEKGMKITIEDLLRDRKENTFDAQDKIDLILKFFVGDCESRVFNENEYRQLGWYENGSYDVINSFYTTYKRALEACGFITYNYKKTYAENALDKEYKAYKELIYFKENKLGSLFEELAKLTHCVANFMPCPCPITEEDWKKWKPRDFNVAKGTSLAHDYLPLFVNLIQEHTNSDSAYYGNLEYDNNKIIEIGVLKEWKKWLIENVDKYCLSCYYKVEGDKLIGIPLFTGQSLDNPYPDNLDKVKECAGNMIKCITSRAGELFCSIHKEASK